jgi:hypothetical protein
MVAGGSASSIQEEKLQNGVLRLRILCSSNQQALFLTKAAFFLMSTFWTLSQWLPGPVAEAGHREDARR